MLAVHVAADPQWTACGECNCVDGRSPWRRWALAGVYDSDLCPRQAVTDESREWLALYAHYAKGHLLRAGGVEDQPAIYLQAMRVIASAVSEAHG